MPRTSDEARQTQLEVISNVEVIRRIKAPAGLSREQTKIFEATVESVPPDWFAPSHLGALTQYARHLAVARRIDQAIERCIASEDYEKLESLLKQQRAESKVVLQLAAALRLTPRSTSPKNPQTCGVPHGEAGRTAGCGKSALPVR